MKVLHVITGLNDGGAEAVLYRLITKSSEHTHIVVSLMDMGKYGPLLEDLGVRVVCLGMNPGKPSIRRFWKLMRLIRAEAPDAVQTWMYHSDLFGGLAARMVGGKKIFWGIRHSTLEKGKAKRTTIAIARVLALTYVLTRNAAEVVAWDNELDRHQDWDFFFRLVETCRGDAKVEPSVIVHWMPGRKVRLPVSSVERFYGRWCEKIDNLVFWFFRVNYLRSFCNGLFSSRV